MDPSSSLKGFVPFLRKHSKWPLSPFKAKWQQTFNQQLAMENLKKSLIPPSPPSSQKQQDLNKSHVLCSLMRSFTMYNCHPTPNAYRFVIKTLIKTSQFHHIPHILHHLERVEKFECPECIFTDLIRVYGNAGNVQDAVDVFYKIPTFRCVPSVYSLNVLLSVLCRNQERLGMVPEILLKSRVMNIRIEESTFRILITALCKINKVGSAIELLNCMITDGFDVDARLCSFMLNSVCKQKDLPGFDVISFLEELRRTGFCPGIRDYANVIKSLFHKGRNMEALNVFRQMKSEGIKPDITFYNLILRVVVAEEDYVKADNLFDELLVRGLVPSLHTYNVYIDGLCKQNKIETAIQLAASMEELGCKPNVITYNALLDAVGRTGDVSRGKELVRDMQLKGIEPNSQTPQVI